MKARRSRVRRHRILAALVMALGGGIAGAAESPAMPAAPVEIAEAVLADFAPVLWAPGSVRSREDARVAGELDGRVISVAEVGARIKRGEPLARLDDAMLRLIEQDDEANIARIEAQLEYARKQEQRFAELREQNSVPMTQIDEARSQRRVLEAELARARVTLEQTRHRQRMTVVRAPFDGVVAERFIQVGEYLATGAPVVRLVNTSELEVSARAPVTLAPRLQAGDPVTVRRDETLVSARIRGVVPVGDEASRQLEVLVSVPAGEWSIGAAVQVALPNAEPRQVVAVPRDALILRASGSQVIKVGDDDTILRVNVDTGAFHDGLVEISGKVLPGDRLVIRGGERLQAGQAVVVGPSGDEEVAATDT